MLKLLYFQKKINQSINQPFTYNINARNCKVEKRKEKESNKNITALLETFNTCNPTKPPISSGSFFNLL